MGELHITDPTEFFRHFADSYPALKPTVPITDELDQRISEMIEEICAGKEISTLKGGTRFRRRKKSETVADHEDDAADDPPIIKPPLTTLLNQLPTML